MALPTLPGQLWNITEMCMNVSSNKLSCHAVTHFYILNIGTCEHTHANTHIQTDSNETDRFHHIDIDLLFTYTHTHTHTHTSSPRERHTHSLPLSKMQHSV